MEVLVTGGSGMVGSALKELCPVATYLSSKDCDLRYPDQVEAVFKKHNPKQIIHLAAKVGGVKGNFDFIADFYTDNVLINSNVLKYASEIKVKNLVSVLSTCVYPDKCTYPLTEDQLHLGPPHESNFGYAYAKRMLEVQSRAYNQQYKTRFTCAIPNNILGTHDNFDLNNGHVIPSLIRKIWEAKHERRNVTLWGDGTPLREFTHASDVARAALFLLWTAKDFDGPVNIGCTQEHSIKEVAETVAQLLEFQGKIIWDTSMPSGQFRKPSSNEKFKSLGFDTGSYLDLKSGLEKTCEWFKNNYPYVRGVKEIKS